MRQSSWEEVIRRRTTRSGARKTLKRREAQESIGPTGRDFPRRRQRTPTRYQALKPVVETSASAGRTRYAEPHSRVERLLVGGGWQGMRGATITARGRRTPRGETASL
jgi:hypothetical protein